MSNKIMSLRDVIENEMNSDNSYQDGNSCDRIIDQYSSANNETQSCIDDIFISLSGWSLDTLISKFNNQKRESNNVDIN